jgi:hypothetical protein
MSRIDVVIRGAGVVVVAGVLATGAYVVNEGGASTANIWVDSSGGTCVDNGSLTAYVDADACGTLDAANDIADNGDVIRVKVGTYASQSITGSNSRTSAATFKPESDTGTIQKLFWTQQTDQAVDEQQAILVDDGSDNIRVEDSDGSKFDIFQATFVTVSGGDWGPCHITSSTPGEACLPKIAGSSGIYATDVVVEDALIHDMTTYDPGSHTGGLASFSGNERVTIRRNKFWNTSVYGMFFATCCGSNSIYHAKDVLVENNWISSTNYMVDLCKFGTPTYEDILIRYNSGRGGFVCMCTEAACGTAGTYTNVRLVGNVNDYSSQSVGCSFPAGTTLNYNVMRSTAGTSCGGTNTGTTTQQYTNSVDTSSIDLNLVDGSVVANGFVTDNTGDQVLNEDIDLESRSSPRDAGASER